MNIRRHTRRECDRARFYVSQGLFKWAATALRRLADDIEREAATPCPQRKRSWLRAVLP